MRDPVCQIGEDLAREDGPDLWLSQLAQAIERVPLPVVTNPDA